MNRVAHRTIGRLDVERYVDGRIDMLQKGFVSQGTPYAKSQLARLRKALTRKPGEAPDVWDLEFSGLPETLRGKGDEPATAGEWAVHLALTLYAVHQQSQQQGMYRRTNWEEREFNGIGHAVNRLALIGRMENRGEQLSPGEMPRRFKALVSAESIEELSHYARQLVTQLRSAGIPLDYARFSGQVYDFQNPYRRDRTKLEWAREFSQQQMTNEDRPNGNKTDN